VTGHVIGKPGGLKITDIGGIEGAGQAGPYTVRHHRLSAGRKAADHVRHLTDSGLIDRLNVGERAAAEGLLRQRQEG
jgi:hypothetical protein